MKGIVASTLPPVIALRSHDTIEVTPPRPGRLGSRFVAAPEAAGRICDFSTKYYDQETGLVYYGRRFYSPSQGRFLGRDTKGEKGGVHLYAFCGNDGVNKWDYLGMEGFYTIDYSQGVV